MGKRVQSPSSINLYKQCPRRYFYQYIKKLPTIENIHLVRGKIAHTVLEKFFDIDAKKINESSYRKEFVFYVKNLFQACWNKAKSKLLKLGMSPEKILVFYEETLLMLANWMNNFFEKLDNLMEEKSFVEAFEQLKPVEREKRYIDENLAIQGFVDYIEVDDGSIKLMDYKTSKRSEINEG
ncbi:PD-(D/E)XK nuclease family protein [Candidatus Woesearchaeota archaeon]|nr:PD-(D/E)XK nuclease family protein [Candidatus Woesearchaeota archaeon]